MAISTKVTCILLIAIYSIESKIFDKCEFGEVMLENGIPLSDLPHWICLVKHASNFDSSKIAIFNANHNMGYGIFQISNKYHCVDEWKPDINECNMDCIDLADDDLTDDIVCAKEIKRKSEFSGGWKPYKYFCKDKPLDKYIEGCDFHEKNQQIPFI